MVNWKRIRIAAAIGSAVVGVCGMLIEKKRHDSQRTLINNIIQVMFTCQMCRDCIKHVCVLRLAEHVQHEHGYSKEITMVAISEAMERYYHNVQKKENTDAHIQ